MSYGGGGYGHDPGPGLGPWPQTPQTPRPPGPWASYAYDAYRTGCDAYRTGCRILEAVETVDKREASGLLGMLKALDFHSDMGPRWFLWGPVGPRPGRGAQGPSPWQGPFLWVFKGFFMGPMGPGGAWGIKFSFL